MNNRPVWFSAKCYGYGSGLPTCWQGWLVLGVYAAVVFGATLLLAEKPLPLASVLVPATVLLMVICARTTCGGWRWRWGSRD